MTDWSDWIGRAEAATDKVSAPALSGLAGLLDHATPPWRDAEAPPLFHWLHFLPATRQSDIDGDGHPKRGDFLPPIELPRRMWAGSRISFLAPVPRDAALTRVSTIRDIREKTGASGRLVFVTVGHMIFANGVAAVEEEQDIVYREAQSRPVATPSATVTSPKPVAVERTMVADPVLLFRYSALTFNAHRIHYDRDYARREEGYPGLVIHGPLLAMLLMDHALRHAHGRHPARFAFAAKRPLFDGTPFDLCLADESDAARLWTRCTDGATTMTATLDWAAS